MSIAPDSLINKEMKRFLPQAGLSLADLHLNYKTIENYPLQIVDGRLVLTDADYRVEKMRHGKNKDLTT